MKKNINILIVLCAIIFAPTTNVFSATYFVDQNHGSASDSNAGTSETAPWLTLKQATNTASAGDIVIVKEGTYVDAAASAGYPYPAFTTNNGSAGNYITFRSEPALAATVRARGWDGTTAGSYMAWGLERSTYVEIDGFKIEGGFRAYAGDHITIKNCELIDGFMPPSDASLLWGIAFEHSKDGLIQNNYVHDLLMTSNSSHNTAGIMLFGNSDRNIIEYNSVNGSNKEIYSAYGVKGGGTDDNIWRYNFGQGVTAGFYGMGDTGGTTPMYRSIIHNNVLVNATSFLEMYKMSIDFDVYNNTAYGCSKFVWAIESSSYGLELWNNIADVTTTLIYWNTYANRSAVPSDLLDYSDYNSFDNAAWYKREASSYTYSLTQWVANTAFGNSSTTTVPTFANAGGYTAADYKRASYPADGRGAPYASVKGAYITGNENIGYHNSDNIVIIDAPAPPSNLRMASSQ